MARIPLVLGGLAAAAGGVAAYLKRRSGESAAFPPRTPLPAPAEAEPGQAASPAAAAPAPAVANVDAAGPPENTATQVPAPEPLVHEPAGGIDEGAEEAAAAAEAANIGGAVSDYPGTEPGETADEDERPLIESGEGEAEGQEVAEFELEDNAEPAAGDPLEGGRQIEDVIEAQDRPDAGEQPFDDQSSHGSPRAEAEQSDPGATTSDAGAAQFEAPAPDARVEGLPEPPEPPEPAAADDDTLIAGTADDGAPTTGGTAAGVGEEQPTTEQPKPEEGDGSEWQTWSGRAKDS